MTGKQVLILGCGTFIGTMLIALASDDDTPVFDLDEVVITPESPSKASNEPRGVRNKNLGNLKLTSIPWKGKIPRSQNTDGTFEQFSTYAYGVRAMILTLKAYINTHKLRTIDKIILRYAPASDNNVPSAYANTVSARSGLSRAQTLSYTKPIIKRLVKAMAFVENGKPVVSDQLFEAAWNLI